MNSILFVNKFVRDDDTLKEIVKYYTFETDLIKAVFVAVIVGCVYSVGHILMGNYIFFSFLIFLLIFVICYFVSYKTNIKNTILQNEEIAAGRDRLCEVTVSDSDIVHAMFGAIQTVELQNIKYAALTKNYIVLHSKANIMYVLKNDSFTIGDTESFVAFLREKGIKVKGKKN